MITPVVCSNREMTNLILFDNISGSGLNLPIEFSGVNENFTWNGIGITSLVYDPSLDIKITFKDRFLNVVREIDAPEVWPTYRGSFFLFSEVRNTLYFACRLAASHPDNISSNDNETWVVSLDLNSSTCSTMVRLRDNRYSNDNIKIYEVTDTHVFFSIGSASTVEQYISVDISTGVQTILWDTAVVGSQGLLDFRREGNDRIVFKSVGHNTTTGLFTIEKKNIDQQTVESYDFDLSGLFNPLWDKSVALNIYVKVIANIVYFVICQADGPVNLLERNFEILVFDMETQVFLERIVGATEKYYQNTVFVMDSNLTIYCGMGNEKTLRVFVPNPIKSTDLLRSNGNILAI